MEDDDEVLLIDPLEKHKSFSMMNFLESNLGIC